MTTSSNSNSSLSSLTFVLGASDPEMVAIEEIVRASGAEIFYAGIEDPRTGCIRRVTPGEAYRVDEFLAPATGQYVPPPAPEGAIWVECGPAPEGAVVCDHHRPGDAGFERGPEDFLAASSIGQVILMLAKAGVRIETHAPGSVSSWASDDSDRSGGRAISHPAGCEPKDAQTSFDPEGYVLWPERPSWIGDRGTAAEWRLVIIDPADTNPPEKAGRLSWPVPEEILLVAAGDHCPGLAYRGMCPGVDPDALMRHRVAVKAAFQGRPEAAVMVDVKSAVEEIRLRLSDVAATAFIGGCHVPDFTSGTVPELPEAALRACVATLATVTERDGRRKVVLGGNDPAQAGIVSAFMHEFAPALGLTDIYGNPARGFAGGYLPPEEPVNPACAGCGVGGGPSGCPNCGI